IYLNDNRLGQMGQFLAGLGGGIEDQVKQQDQQRQAEQAVDDSLEAHRAADYNLKSLPDEQWQVVKRGMTKALTSHNQNVQRFALDNFGQLTHSLARQNLLDKQSAAAP